MIWAWIYLILFDVAVNESMFYTSTREKTDDPSRRKKPEKSYRQRDISQTSLRFSSFSFPRCTMPCTKAHMTLRLWTYVVAMEEEKAASQLHLCSFWHFSSAFHVRTKIPSPVVIRVGRSRYKLQKLNAQFWEKIMWWWQTKTPKLQLCKYCSSHDLCVQGKKERKAMWEAQKSKEEYLDIFRTTRGNQFFRTYRFFFSFLSLPMSVSDRLKWANLQIPYAASPPLSLSVNLFFICKSGCQLSFAFFPRAIVFLMKSVSKKLQEHPLREYCTKSFPPPE